MKEKKIKEKKIKEKKIKVSNTKKLKNYLNQNTFLGITLAGTMVFKDKRWRVVEIIEKAK